MRLFQVPPDDLRILAPPFSCAELEPIGEACVQVRTRLLGDCVIRSVADQEMVELERLFDAKIRPARPDELLADEVEQHGRHAARHSW